MDLTTALRDRRQASLLKAALKGDANSIKSLYGELFDHVYKYIFMKIHNRHDVEDLVSEVFYRFLKVLDTYDSKKGSVMAWIITMSRNAVIDFQRSSGRTIPLADYKELDRGHNPDTLSRIVESEQIAQVEALLSALPPTINDLFHLRIGMNLRWSEIARILNTDELVLRKQFSRTVKAIKDKYHRHLKNTVKEGRRATT